MKHYDAANEKAVLSLQDLDPRPPPRHSWLGFVLPLVQTLEGDQRIQQQLWFFLNQSHCISASALKSSSTFHRTCLIIFELSGTDSVLVYLTLLRISPHRASNGQALKRSFRHNETRYTTTLCLKSDSRMYQITAATQKLEQVVAQVTSATLAARRAIVACLHRKESRSLFHLKFLPSNFIPTSERHVIRFP